MKPLIIVRKLLKVQGVFTLSFALLMFLTGGYFFSIPQFAHAAALTSLSDTISDSTPGANANHTFLFVTAFGLQASTEVITLTFDNSPQFDLTGITEDDVDIAYDDDNACDGSWTEITTLGTADATNYGVSISGQVITITHSTGDTDQDIPAGRCVQIEIGANATASGTGSNQINNASKVASVGTADVYTIDILVDGGGTDDSGTAMTASIEGVDVSVSVAETLSFVIAAVASGACADGKADGTSVTTTVSGTITVPFGAATVDTLYNGCLDLTVSTNATDGYTMTVEKDVLLTSGSDTIADGVCDASCSSTVVDTWTTVTQNGFGYCLEDTNGNAAETTDSSDDSGTGATDWVDANQCDHVTTPAFKLIPTTTTTESVMKSYAAVSGDVTRMLYRVSIDAAQIAGSYSNIVTYVLTPVF